MLGSNPSADSVASTDRQGDASRIPFFTHPLAPSPASGEAPSDKSWGWGQSPCNLAHASTAPSKMGDLS